MSLKKGVNATPSDRVVAEGLLSHDWTVLTPCQRECTTRLGTVVQLEQEAYLSEHPEVKAMLSLFMSKMVRVGQRRNTLKEMAQYFVRPVEILDEEIRQHLTLPIQGMYSMKDKPTFVLEKNMKLTSDMEKSINNHYPPDEQKIPTPIASTPNTASSSFISVITSETTLPTPEPVLTPEPTLSENMFTIISNTVDKAIFLHVDDQALRYDTAYVELQKVVENAMEIPVIEIREDIAALLYNAYKMFQLDIMEKERIAAEIAWEKRMRKKTKRTLRCLNNFKGYETPPTPKSEISSHESYKKAPPRPCVCYPQYNYNRYPKDRFGIYLPRAGKFSDCNVTATPAISMEGLPLVEAEEPDAKSIISGKSTVSHKQKSGKN